MDITPFRLLLLDAASHAVLLADGPSGRILSELPLPAGCTPVDLVAAPAAGTAVVALATADGAGALCRLSLSRPAVERLPLALPRPARLALTADGSAACLADAAGALTVLSLASLSTAAWGRPPGCGGCAGLAWEGGRLWAAWENGGGGLLAAYNANGLEEGEYPLGGLPTGLVSDRPGRLLLTFTASPFSGEGLLVVDTGDGQSSVIPLLCSRCAAGHRIYPVHAAACGDTAYIACEDSAAVTVADLAAGRLTGSIFLGHSISRLALVPGGRFAVASSNASAELGLIDLVNRRPLSFTASGREILSPLAVI